MPGGSDVTAISLWDNKADAEAYDTIHIQVLKTFAKVIDGTPGQAYEVVNSTFHRCRSCTRIDHRWRLQFTERA